MIKGSIIAIPSDFRVANMKVGQKAYLDVYDILLTRDFLYVDHYAPIIPEEFYDMSEDEEVVIIRRIGPGLTESDFELDFTEYEGSIDFEGDATDIKIERYRHSYVVFTTFTAVLKNDVEPPKQLVITPYSELTLKELEKELEDLLVTTPNDYETAIILRDLIAERKAGRKDRNRPGGGKP